MASVREVEVSLPHDALPDADWADAYQVEVGRSFENARSAGEVIINSFPKWTYPALVLRQILVSPFGLKGADAVAKTDRMGIFPVVAQTDSRVVAGFNDRHLDFRVVVDLEDGDHRQTVTLATVIRRHNRLGKFYLQMVLPFHRLIIRSALAKLA